MKTTKNAATFPCFGNELESTFNLTIIHESGFQSAANGALVNGTEDSQPEGWFVDTYAWTTEIQPELVSFVVFPNNFSSVESVFGKENKSVTIYALGEDINKVFQYTTNVSAEILAYYEDYFGTSARVPNQN
ncbi:unnamed protein product [Orchesella dallaii]|uniref:Uncharacterized protein n=1 Tax=Orchesella dallaii TaxID=48710 RepID=A0ABP1S8N9_9HEXA